jgi:ABC-2 type transport system permease protein
MMIFLAYYANAAIEPPMPRDHVVTYVWLGQAFLLLLPFRGDYELQGMIRTGRIAHELLRPVDLYSFWFSRAIAVRVAPTLLRAAPMLVIAALFGWIRWPGIVNVAACSLALCGAVALGAAITVLMNITLFWTLSGRGINTLLGAGAFFLSGLVVPLPMFPDFLQPLLRIQPFRGLGDVPFRLFTGHIPLSGLAAALAHQFLWALALVLLGRWLLARALHRVVIQGG